MTFPSSWRRRAVLALANLALAACASPADPWVQTAPPHAASHGNGVAFVHQGQADSPAPTVVFQSGLGDDHRTWSAVLQQLPGQYEAVAADRPGYGDSPAPQADEVRDACRIAEEQRALLRSAGLRPPYVLVGHSLGGWYQYVYARLSPDEVAGLVLLDPTHPRLQAALQTQHPAANAVLQLARRTVFTPAMGQEFDAQSGCVEQVEQHAPLAAPALLLASTEAPVYVGAELQQTLDTLRQDWLARSGATLTLVPRSGHRIQQDAPQAVVQAIEALARPAEAAL